MNLQVNSIALQQLTEKIKNGGTFKCEKVDGNFDFLLTETENGKTNEINCKADNFKVGFENFVDKFSSQKQKGKTDIQIESNIESILNRNFSLRIGSKVLHLAETPVNKDLTVFESFYFNVSNGALSTDTTSKSFEEGLKIITQQACLKYDEIEA